MYVMRWPLPSEGLLSLSCPVPWPRPRAVPCAVCRVLRHACNAGGRVFVVYPLRESASQPTPYTGTAAPDGDDDAPSDSDDERERDLYDERGRKLSDRALRERDLRAATDELATLRTMFPGANAMLLKGDMKAAEKDEVLEVRACARGAVLCCAVGLLLLRSCACTAVTRSTPALKVR